jgi:thioredoxin reductase
VTRRYVGLVVAAVVLVMGALVFGEHPAASPGALRSGHTGAEWSCRTCHEPFRGVTDSCERCHGELPAQNVHARSDVACAACHFEHAETTQTLAERQVACTNCHEHTSVAAVKAHHAKILERPLEAKRHVVRFSHEFHFDQLRDSFPEEDPLDCQRCHAVGEASGETDATEHALRWSGCTPCHYDWDDAGFGRAPNVPPGATLLTFDKFIEVARFPRLRFRHVPAHSQVPCLDCHVEIEQADELPRSAHGKEAGGLAAKKTRGCFTCHAHGAFAGSDTDLSVTRLGSVDSAEQEPVVTACAQCHVFHGDGADADFAGVPSIQPVPSHGVWFRVGGLAVTPWLLAFLFSGALGLVGLMRVLPVTHAEEEVVNPDVAPQRVAEVPVLSASYESSMPGLFIIGELASVPLINRSMKSGFDAIDYVHNQIEVDGRRGGSEVLDVLIAGAGPAGLGAATRAASLGLSYVLCEKDTAASTIKNYPRAKIVQAAPIDVPQYGTFFQSDDESKEGLMRRWQDIIARTGILVSERQQLVELKKSDDGNFLARTASDKEYKCRFVVLAIGVRGTPRRLNVPGETPDRVVYSLIDPTEYRSRAILVSGGGNTACEAALALADPELLNQVALAHRGAVLKDVTPQNSQAVDNAAREGRLEVIANSTVGEIAEGRVVLRCPSGDREISNDVIFALIGADLPTKFLRSVGVKLVRKGGV